MKGGFMVLKASFLVIKAHVLRRFPLNDDRRSGQAGTGDARITGSRDNRSASLTSS